MKENRKKKWKKRRKKKENKKKDENFNRERIKGNDRRVRGRKKNPEKGEKLN
jgi:hypothetical protein